MSQEEVIPILIFGVIGAVLVGTVLFHVARFLKGSLKVEVQGKAFNPGDTIQGHCELKARRDIEAERLYVALVGEEVIRERRRSSKGNRTRTRTRRREIFRQEHDIMDGQNIEAGHESKLSFQIEVPDKTNEESDFSLGDGQVAKAVKLGAQLLSGQRRHIQWHVHAQLKASGIDLKGRQRVHINA